MQVSTYKSKIDETTRKMMALVSELSMQQVSTYIQYVCMYVSTYVHSVCMYVFICNCIECSHKVYIQCTLLCSRGSLHCRTHPICSSLLSYPLPQCIAGHRSPAAAVCVCEYEATLEGAYTRMQNGEAPTDDIDQEWRRMLRLQETRQREDETRKQVSVL